ncbi:MAG: PAS domain S-box protein [Planctomycetota bacterium]
MAANLPPRELKTPESPPATSRGGILTLIVYASFCAGMFDRADTVLWSPMLGVALAGTVWFGPRFLVALLIAVVGIALAFTPAGVVMTPLQASLIGVVQSLEVAAAWWFFTVLARGSRHLDDPRSAVLFLLLVPGVAAALAAVAQISLAAVFDPRTAAVPIFRRFGEDWIAGMLGSLVITPFLLVNFTRSLQRLQVLPPPNGKKTLVRPWTFGESIELTGLAFGNFLLSLIQVHLHRQIASAAWPLWGISLLLVVWSSIRQGLRGGTVTAFAGCAAALVWATQLGVSPAAFSPLQGNLLAQCGIALLVGASVGWIRATEARYRHVVGHIPLVLTSVRLNHGITFLPNGVPVKTTSDSKPELKGGATLLNEAEIVLVSRASKDIIGIDAEQLVGPFSQWLAVVHPEDREIVIAGISQLAMQRQTVSCEYRILGMSPEPTVADPRPVQRWVRDTLAPHYTGDGLLDGWDGVVEEITDQRHLQQENRRIAGMLQALIANMPTGVFFVQGPNGQPILVNARARQLLGQREDMSAGIVHIAEVYRLHRQDGSVYPTDDLPIAKALRYGQTSTANDIIVHRPDGRRVPLFTWAAPIDLGNVGRPEAAVWVLEDLTALQQAEFARRESEARLRAVFEALAEGVLVYNKAGVIIEGNPSAANILGMTIDQLIGRSWLCPDQGCLRDDGSPCPSDQQPDRLALQIKLPIRNVVIGLPRGSGEVRWVLVNSMPLPVGTAFSPNSKGAQLVTTFADVSAERLAQRILLTAKEKYQSLVETLPVMVFQLDAAGAVLFMNPAAQQFLGADTGHFAAAGVFEELFEAADRPRVSIAIQEAMYGKDARFEFGIHSVDGALKIGLAIVQPLRQEDKVVGSTWIVIDMTRQRRLEEELVKAQRLELVGRLASGTVHDFNNLMMSVIGTASVLKIEAANQPHLVENLDIIERTATQASELLAEILALGKNLTRPSQALSLNKVIHDTLLLLKNVIPANIRVSTRFPKEEITVIADDLQLKQVILNLCLNARDAMPTGGVLEIRTRVDRRGAGAWAVVTVEDNGQGIPRDLQSKIYDPFFTTKERGSGIGLSVVRDIVQRLGGTIDVWSDEGSGARFEIGIKLRESRPEGSA